MSLDTNTAVVVVRLHASRNNRFQGILGGEEGLATLRCMHSERGEQELWTSRAQVAELRRWLQSLPADLGVEIVREYVYEEAKENECP